MSQLKTNNQKNDTIIKQSLQKRRTRTRKNRKKKIPSERTLSSIQQELKVKLKHDPRSSDGESSLMLPSASPAIPIEVLTSSSTFAGAVIAAISYALGRGWTLTVEEASFPYFAYVYTVKILEQAAKNGVPSNFDVPKWLALMIQALTQKEVKKRSGMVTYAFKVNEDFTDDWEVPMGPLAYSRIWNIGRKEVAGTLLNGLFSKIVAPTAYSEEDGQRAVQSMWLYLQAVTGHPMHKLVPADQINAMSRDSSAYAVVDPSPGGGYGRVGGHFETLSLETPVRTPCMGVFNTTYSDIDVTRSKSFVTNWAGDGGTLGMLLVRHLEENQIHMKSPVRWKFIDFLEFAEVLALYVCKMIQLRVNTEEFKKLMIDDPDYYTNVVQCPLTILEMQAMLRGVLMAAFQDTQIGGQSIYPRVPDETSNEFVAFVCGTGLNPNAGTTLPQLPNPFVENVKALTSKTLYGGRAGELNPTIFAPVLGKYYEDELDTKDFTVQYVDKSIEVDETLNCFYVDVAEEKFDLIDGKATTDIYAIGDPGPLGLIAERWNNWILRMGDYTRPTDSISTDGGCGAWYSLCMSRHWQVVLPRPGKDDKKPQRKKKTPQKPNRWAIPEKLGVPSSIYGDRSNVVVSSSVPPFTTVWQGFQQFMIMPINKLSPSVTKGNATTYQRMAAFLNEPYKISIGEDESNFITLSEIHNQLADLMVKTPLAAESVVTQLIDEFNKSGKAGIISSIGATLLGIVAPSTKAVANQIASMIPF